MKIIYLIIKMLLLLLMVKEVSISLISLFWEKVFILKTFFDVNDISNTIGVATIKLVPGPLDILGFNHFAVWIDFVLEAKVNALLSILDSTNERSTDALSVCHQLKVRKLVRSKNTTKLANFSILLH